MLLKKQWGNDENVPIHIKFSFRLLIPKKIWQIQHFFLVDDINLTQFVSCSIPFPSFLAFYLWQIAIGAKTSARSERPHRDSFIVSHKASHILVCIVIILLLFLGSVQNSVCVLKCNHRRPLEMEFTALEGNPQRRKLQPHSHCTSTYTRMPNVENLSRLHCMVEHLLKSTMRQFS